MEIEPVDVVGFLGRDFVIYDSERMPRFEARLLDQSKTLKIAWTDNIPWTPYWIRQVQRLAGGPGSFTCIEGFATDEFATAVRRGLLDKSEIGERVMRALGGRWTALLTRRSEDWVDIMVRRVGD